MAAFFQTSSSSLPSMTGAVSVIETVNERVCPGGGLLSCAVVTPGCKQSIAARAGTVIFFWPNRKYFPDGLWSLLSSTHLTELTSVSPITRY
jgi:hypothetical protein